MPAFILRRLLQSIRRGICPSCGTRRMNEAAAYLVLDRKSPDPSKHGHFDGICQNRDLAETANLSRFSSNVRGKAGIWMEIFVQTLSAISIEKIVAINACRRRLKSA